ncbi:MAG: hypothetical protein IKR97_03680 [Eubacterium sp.]|nr:hypothetical protein [Eubacterium sp.]
MKRKKFLRENIFIAERIIAFSILGIILGIIYFAFYILRRIIKKSGFDFFDDILFMVLCSFSFMSVLIAYCSGEMRFIYLLCAFLSFSGFLALLLSFNKFSTKRLKLVEKRKRNKK